MNRDTLIISLWLVLGIVNLTSDEISKIQYFLTWLLLMIHLVNEVVRVF